MRKKNTSLIKYLLERPNFLISQKIGEGTKFARRFARTDKPNIYFRYTVCLVYFRALGLSRKQIHYVMYHIVDSVLFLYLLCATCSGKGAPPGHSIHELVEVHLAIPIVLPVELARNGATAPGHATTRTRPPPSQES